MKTTVVIDYARAVGRDAGRAPAEARTTGAGLDHVGGKVRRARPDGRSPRGGDPPTRRPGALTGKR